MARNEKRLKAKQLFLTGQYTQKEIAEITETSEKTLSTWKKEDDWESLKESLLTTRENELRRLYKMLRVLNDAIDDKAAGNIPINSKEADSVLKLTAAIRNLELETSIADKVEVATAFIDYIRKDDLEMSKKIANLFDGFLKQFV
ncbi:MAG: DDE transposase family protein [Verrucomicrobia bacterium]|nr:DDE transposase family protein [Verrucomicrobiota bacterium]